MVANETLAQQRGRELKMQMRVNQLVIRDMQDGFLVVDGQGRIRQNNPRASQLLGVLPQGRAGQSGADFRGQIPRLKLRAE